MANPETPKASISPTVTPVSYRERIVSLDMLRGVALLGILPMNIQSYAMISAAYMNPMAYGDLHGANLAVWLLSHVLADEKFMTIFSLLFGAGILLMTSRAESRGRRSGVLHYRRMAWLVLFGMAHAYLLWSGDILYTYGLCGMVAYPFRKCRPRTLLIVGLACSLVTPAFMTLAGATMPYWQQGADELKEDLWMPTPQHTAEETAGYRGGWLAEMGPRVEDAIAMETQFFLLWASWRVLGLMLWGMALLKVGALSAEWPAQRYRNLIALALLVGIPLISSGTYRDFKSGWDFRESFFYGMHWNWWGSYLVSGGWIGAVMLLRQSGAVPAMMSRLAAVGRMAFSNYILHSVLCTFIFYGHGLGLFGSVSRVGQAAVVLGVWALQLWLSPIWLRRFQFGPLEWLWRSLTYWQRQPMRAA